MLIEPIYFKSQTYTTKKIVNLIGLFQVQQTHQFSLRFNSSGVVLRDADVLALVLPLQVVGDQVAGVLLDGPTGKERKKGALVTFVNLLSQSTFRDAPFWAQIRTLLW